MAELLALGKSAFFPIFFPRFLPRFPFPPHFCGSRRGWIPDGIKAGMGSRFSQGKKPGKKLKNPPQPPGAEREKPQDPLLELNSA